MSEPRILFLDIESSGMKSFTWGRYDQRVSQEQVIQESFLFCYAYKWLHEKHVGIDSMRHHVPLADIHEGDDKSLLINLWNLLDEADIVCGHYLKRFDIPEINRRFAVHNMPPPSPYKMLCTKEQAKKHFRFSSNRLGDLGIALGLGGKLKHTGFEVWKGCWEGDEKAFKLMERYNIQDVRLLEQVYKRLLPFMSNHPNLSSYTEKECCPKCGSEDTEKRGFARTLAGKYQRYLCKSCGGWHRGRTNVLTKEERACIVANVA